MGETLIYGLHAVMAALNSEPEQVRGLWLERQRRETFPRGLDVLFAAGHHLIGLPRSTRIAQEHA